MCNRFAKAFTKRGNFTLKERDNTCAVPIKFCRNVLKETIVKLGEKKKVSEGLLKEIKANKIKHNSV